MQYTNEQRIAKIRELEQKLPTIKCKGLCHNFCVRVDTTDAEHKLIKDTHGVDLPRRSPREGTPLAPPNCVALNQDTKRCNIYDVRPHVCRAWGVTQVMPCKFGCEVDGEPLGFLETGKMLNEVIIAGGGMSHYSASAARKSLADLATPQGAQAYTEWQQEDLRRTEGFWQQILNRPKENPSCQNQDFPQTEPSS